MEGKFATFMKQGPPVKLSKKAQALLMRSFMAILILAVVLLLVWTRP